MIVGIDASNIRGGGGVTHLVELLRAANPAAHGFSQVIVWSGQATLSKIEDRPWLVKSHQSLLDKSLFYRTFWQRFRLSRLARLAGCDVLFVPGGSYAGDFHPMVTMSRNLLPFEWTELRRFGFSLTTFKLIVLRFTQSHSFKGAEGMIFLTEYAKQAVLKVTGQLSGETAVIAHGLSPRFQMPPKVPRPIQAYTAANPYRLLYVSIIDQYKHQWHLVEAVHSLRAQGLPVVLELIGPAYRPALARLQAAIAQFDAEKVWVHYHGAVPYEALHTLYAHADLGVFASSCENMPNILIEFMAAGLPLACSNRGPMPEILGGSGVYFNPEDPISIAAALETMIEDPSLRTRCAVNAFGRASQYSWTRCARETFSFLAEIARSHAKQAREHLLKSSS